MLGANSFCIVVVVDFSNLIKRISYNFKNANTGKEQIFLSVISDYIFLFFDKFI